MSQEPKVFAGDKIGALFEKPQSSSIEIVNKQYGKLVFEVRPMNNDVYSSMGIAMRSEGIDIEKIDDLNGLKLFANVYYPAMKVVFPYCCINPKVIDGVSTDKSTLSVKDIPMDVAMELYTRIMESSGLSDKGDAERKKE